LRARARLRRISGSPADAIIAAGFAIFVRSDFPPTQRFGLVVLAGCVIDILANLFVLPLLGGAQWKTKQCAQLIR
jgi:predicted RND superfamily exporter protein